MAKTIFITNDKSNILNTNVVFNCAKTVALKNIVTLTYNTKGINGKYVALLFCKIYITATLPTQLCKIIDNGM